MAADRQSSGGGLVTRCRKLFKVQQYAIGVSGNLASGILFRNWWDNRRQGDCPLDEDTHALVMDTNTGVCELWEHPGVGIPIEEDFASIGSGSGIAYGALEMGATARQAVSAAIKWDESSGVGVHTITSKNASESV